MIHHDNLEEFHDPANYDIEEAAESALRAQFYGDLATHTGEPVLEIACGTGLVAIPIAARGLAVTGADICLPMLDHARARSRRLGLSVRWVEGDARTLALDTRFALVYLTGNAFQAFLRDEDQRAMLSRVRAHMTENSVFAFETRNPGGHDLVTHAEERDWHRYTNVAGHEVRVSGQQRYDEHGSLMHWTTWRRWREGDDEQLRVTRIACRFTSEAELDALLDDAGFCVEQRYGDWDKSPLASTSPSIINVCRLR